MARVIGIDIPKQKRIVISLTYLYGIGRNLAKEVCEKLALDPNTKTQNLTQSDVARLNEILQSQYTVEGNLRREVRTNIDEKIRIGCYQGIRHKKNLPVRGQSTKTNARTRKGKKKTVANKKA
jgi:small subunit ribosomal protein S13